MHATQDEGGGFLSDSAQTLGEFANAYCDRTRAARLLVDWGVLSGESRQHLVAFAPGGLSVAREIARLCGLPFALAIVSEFSPPWPGGPSFGAAAFDGTVVLDDELKELCAVSRAEFDQLVEGAYERVAGLLEEHRDDAVFPSLKGQTAIVIDDGLAAPLSTRAVIAAVRNAGARRVVLVLLMGGRRNVARVSEDADLTYCASLASLGGDSLARFAPSHFSDLASWGTRVQYDGGGMGAR